jgi:alkanesulfonate monooxygenase SsuD/methylene tetrahydromethanopterin reductase-like flavin-dependent oxidoreductase (luciferase family)
MNSTMTRIAVGITPLETRREVVLHLATRAEELGYTAFSVAEGWGHDAAVLLAEIAGRTSRIGLGTGVLNVWGRSPATIAMLATSLQAASAGRFTLGLGAGSPALAEGLHGVPFRHPVARLGATVREVRRLLAGERATGHGDTRPLRLAAPGEVPIALAGLGPAAIRLAGELADAWNPFLLPVSGLKDRTGLLSTGVRPTVGPAVPVAPSREVASWWVTFYLTSMGPLYARTLRELGLGAEVDAVVAGRSTPDVLIEELTIADRAGLDRWVDAGAEVPIVVLPPGRPVDELDDILQTLAPT